MFYKSYLEISKKYAYMIIILLMYPLLIHKAFPGGSEVKNLPAMRETWVQSLGWEDPLEKGKLPTPVFWPEESHGLCSLWGRKEWDTTE